MRLTSPALCAMVAALMAGCSGNMSPTNSSIPSSPQGTQGHSTVAPSLIPERLRPTGPMKLHGRSGGVSPNSAHSSYGLYVSQFYATDILAYMTPNTGNSGPSCSISPASYVNDVASDDGSNLIDPDTGTHSIIIYRGPKLCGSEAGSINDPYGIPTDASSNNATHQAIAVGNIYDGLSYFNPAPGSVSVCTMSGGCTANLTNPNMFEVFGVVMDSGGDCWASSYDSNKVTWLTYFAGCTGSGETATGFVNASPGGLDIDKAGHILALDTTGGALYVYSGCNPACTLVSGPQALEGDAIFGHLDRSSMDFATADFQYGQIDVYTYKASTGKLKYAYSFNNGLDAANLVEGATFTPRAHQ